MASQWQELLCLPGFLSCKRIITPTPVDAQEIKTNVDTKNHLVFLNYYLTPLFLYRISFLILSTASQKAHSNESLDHVQIAFPCGTSRSFSDSKMGASIP